MAKIYLINVGANIAHRNRARSPLFPDDSFEYVSFPDETARSAYPSNVRQFVKPSVTRTHLDPDWDNLTYGDCCQNRRARSLLSVEPDDILLFWGLLWRIEARRFDVFSSADRGWYLLGALRVKLVMKSGDNIDGLFESDLKRLRENDHVFGDRIEMRDLVRVFLGKRKYSRRFDRAVDLQIYKKDSLLVETVRTADNRRIEWYESPRWNSVTRACRPILDLSTSEQYSRAFVLRDAIRDKNPSYDLLVNV